MTEDGGYYTWKKGVNEPFPGPNKVTPYFRTTEFSCHCDLPECVEQKISVDLIERLNRVREEAAIPVKVTSGYRCGPYQAKLRGSGILTAKGTSTHELGHAADVSSRDMKKLLEHIQDEFKAIGLAKSFYHVDLRDDKERRWLY
jgi:uncharacterized protein YcbK (DUF882 family)